MYDGVGRWIISLSNFCPCLSSSAPTSSVGGTSLFGRSTTTGQIAWNRVQYIIQWLTLFFFLSLTFCLTFRYLCISFFKMLSVLFEVPTNDFKLCKYILPPAKLSQHSARFHRRAQRKDAQCTSFTSDEESPSWAQGVDEDFIAELEKVKGVVLDRSLRHERCYRLILSPYFDKVIVFIIILWIF